MPTTADRFRSRKFIIAFTELVSVTFMAAWGCHLSGGAGDVALVIGAWGVVAGAIGKLYSDANLKDKEGDGR